MEDKASLQKTSGNILVYVNLQSNSPNVAANFLLSPQFNQWASLWKDILDENFKVFCIHGVSLSA